MSFCDCYLPGFRPSRFSNRFRFNVPAYSCVPIRITAYERYMSALHLRSVISFSMKMKRQVGIRSRVTFKLVHMNLCIRTIYSHERIPTFVGNGYKCVLYETFVNLISAVTIFMIMMVQCEVNLKVHRSYKIFSVEILWLYYIFIATNFNAYYMLCINF